LSFYRLVGDKKFKLEQRGVLTVLVVVADTSDSAPRGWSSAPSFGASERRGFLGAVGLKKESRVRFFEEEFIFQ
jgi:hypothetical protein